MHGIRPESPVISIICLKHNYNIKSERDGKRGEMGENEMKILFVEENE